MALDIYVGSLTRYYCRDWETVVQRWGREQGVPVKTVRPEADDDAIRDPARIRPIVLAWRKGLAKALRGRLRAPLDWDEGPRAPYFTGRPAWEPYADLLVVAAHEEHPDLPLPAAPVGKWMDDEACRRSAAGDSGTRYPNLLRGTETWLPADFPFVFRAPDAGGHDLGFGSAPALVRELELLAGRAWMAGADEVEGWRLDGPPPGLPSIEAGARSALALMLDLARKAGEHRLVMKLDY